jgi:hypothetical protein
MATTQMLLDMDRAHPIAKTIMEDCLRTGGHVLNYYAACLVAASGLARFAAAMSDDDPSLLTNKQTLLAMLDEIRKDIDRMSNDEAQELRQQLLVAAAAPETVQ